MPMFLLPEREPATSLFTAAQEEDLSEVKRLLDGGEDVNEASLDGYTPLCVAAQNGHHVVVHLLLDYDADVNKAESTGKTPLYIAASCCHLVVVQLLLDYDADVNKAERKGKTPLYIAASLCHLPVVKLLLDREAGVSSPMAQWVPALPAYARTVLVTWARAAVQDAGVCYAVFYADLVSPTLPDALVHEWRGLVGHDGVVGLRRLIVSFLVHPKAGTRRALWELAAMGDLGASAGVEAVSVEAAVAAARSAAVVRARWAFVQEPDEASTRYKFQRLKYKTNIKI